jgi:hypothetical protein
MLPGGGSTFVQAEPPVCPECKRPVAPWLERSSAGTIEAAPGKYVCYSPLCSRYGVVVLVAPPDQKL